MKKKLVTASVEQIVTLKEAKEQLHIEIDYYYDDDYLLSLIRTSVSYVESFCDIKLMAQTWTQFLSSWSEVEALKIPILQSIDEISYLNETAVDNIIPTTDYIVGRSDNLVINKDVSMPTDLYQVDPIAVKYTLGYYQASEWFTNTVYGLGGQVLIPSSNLVAECIVAGTSDSGMPEWSNTIGDSVIDGTVTWQIKGLALPAALKQAILILITNYYENRESGIDKSTETAIHNLLIPYRSW